jgi:V/A-type H+-transporting ATPase subunit A
MSNSIVSRISGSVVVATDVEDAEMYHVVRIGELGLLGEIIRLEGNKATIQVYEDTTGIRPGEKVINTKRALSMQLGPGLLKSIYDGIQRPLDILREKSGDFIGRGVTIPALDQHIKWEFIPNKNKNDEVQEGEIIGEVQETPLINHKIMVPFGVNGKISEISEGKYTVNENVAEIKTTNGKSVVGLSSWWMVRTPRPVFRKLPPESPLLTGQRVLDTFFPVAKGGTAAIPGPFGSGKTVTQQQLAKWADSSVIVYIGCGERGNEMTEILTTFPELEDPKSKRP